MCRRVLGIGIGGFKGGCKFETVEIDKRRNEFWTITIARRAWRLFVLREVQHQVSTEAEAVKVDCEDAGGLCAGGIVAGLGNCKAPLFKPLLRQAFATIIIALDAYALGDIQKNKSDVVIWWHFAATALYVVYDQLSRFMAGKKYEYEQLPK